MIFFKTKFYDLNIIVLIVVSRIDIDELEYYLDEMNVSDVISNKTRNIISSPNTGFTYSKGNYTIMFINRSTSMNEFVNTWEHEKNHIEMYLCDKYQIDPYSEEASYLSGDLGKHLYTCLTNVILEK